MLSPFDADRYLGTWFEVARMDFFFERGLNNTTAIYTRNPDGSIKVVNRGYNPQKDRWKTAEGRAVFVGSHNEGRLKVSFFGPFYGAYNIIALDDDYRYAMVSGNDTDNLWILSRTPALPEEVRNRYLAIARQAGFAVNELLWIEHDKSS
ncbi:lipocalin family protein [Marispirochaeta aestuarii]|uniref:lipocalin family protein n=1 Tax=Marispirochaeta aestuarii TaxID=1963862 RepID=UPI0029C7161D|nr:lipocalin family protein [Marispirochaeta aestuarii]